MNIKCYQLVEIKSEKEILSAKLTNAQDQILLTPFKLQPIVFSYNNEGFESVEKSGDIVYAVRFSVSEEGNYNLCLSFADGGVECIDFIATDFKSFGFIGVSSRDSRYFSYSDGSAFFPIGLNTAFPTAYAVSNGSEFGRTNNAGYLGLRQYERWFKKCSENGVNMVRIWAGHDYFSPDTDDCKILNFEQFSKLDALISLAKKYNLKVKITLEQFRYFSDNPNGDYVFKLFNKSLILNGKPCVSMKEWLQKDKWRKAWLNKISEFSARYSYDTTIFAIELWNEMNCVENSETFEDVCEWNRYMLPQIKKLFPNHMVINSLGSLDNTNAYENYKSFPWELTDFKQVHKYLDQGAQMICSTQTPIEAIKSGFDMMNDTKTPLLIAETGAVDNCHCGPFRYYSADDRGIFFVDCVYTAVFVGGAGCGNIWHWDYRYLESKNLYHLFKPLSELVNEIDFSSEEFRSVNLSDEDVWLFILQGKNTTIGFVRNKADNWQNNYRDNKNILPVQSKSFELGVSGSIKCFDIWQEDTTKIKLCDKKLLLSDILYGTIFKIVR